MAKILFPEAISEVSVNFKNCFGVATYLAMTTNRCAIHPCISYDNRTKILLYTFHSLALYFVFVLGTHIINLKSWQVVCPLNELGGHRNIFS